MKQKIEPMEYADDSPASKPTILGKLILNFRRYGFRRFPSWVFHQLEWRWLRNVRKTRFTEREIQGFRLILDLDDIGVSKELFLSDIREEEHIFMLNQFVEPGMTILDCGANIGYYTVMMGKLVGPGGSILAVEPSRENFQLLALNVRLNQLENRVQLFNIGMGDYTGTGTMYHSKMSNRHTFHPVEYFGPSEQTLDDRSPVDVPMSTISEFMKGDNSLDLIRMDVEGFEVEILKGLTDALADSDFAPSILFEVHRPRYDVEKHDIRAPLKAMFAAGYHVKWLAADGHKSRSTRDSYEQLGYGKNRIAAYFSSSDRAIYTDLSDEHALELISDSSDVRAVFLERKRPS